VYIPRRDTSSRLAALAGGRLVPGYLHLARFRAHEDCEGYRIEVASRDGMVHIEVEAHRAGELPPGSIFTSLASSFFDDRHRFPAGTAEPDSAFLMSGLSTVWHPQPRLQVIAAAGRPVTT
jgi:hypothetical protein